MPHRAGSDPVVEDRILRSRRAKQGRPPDAETLERTLTQEGVIAGTLPYMAPGTTAGQTGRRARRHFRLRLRGLRDVDGQARI